MNQSGRKIKTVYKQREDKMLRAGRKLQTTHFVRYCTVIGANAPSSISMVDVQRRKGRFSLIIRVHSQH